MSVKLSFVGEITLFSSIKEERERKREDGGKIQ
jgi:hypothetical protein